VVQSGLPDPVDQQPIAGPRIGYSGVIDERLDLALIADVAARRPDWQFVFLGPVVKINPDELPQGPNLHYLGMKSYEELPAYFSNWQAAWMPFAINEATRYISPTKTPEYLAAGLPVVSSPVRDVVRTYGGWERVVIADSASAFQCGLALVLRNAFNSDQPQLDRFLLEQSWENTWQQMHRILNGQLKAVAGEQ
jgi:glycosyltransferase involved in cell wall biosynthesis